MIQIILNILIAVLVLIPVTADCAVYSLHIGISEYQSERIPDLDFADNDAVEIAKTLARFNNVMIDNIYILLNDAATKKNIEKQILRLARHLEKNDILIISFSGHGTYGEDYDGDEEDGTDEYLLPYDALVDELDSSAISDDIFGYWLKKFKAKNIILFIDSCHSGGASKGVKGLISFRGKGKRALSKDTMVSDIKRKGLSVFAACKADEEAQELIELRQGLFSYYVIKGLQGNADGNSDKSISLNELNQFVHSKVRNWAFRNNIQSQNPVSLISKDFHLPLLHRRSIVISYVSHKAEKILITPAKRNKIKISDGYYETRKIQGHWVKLDGYKVWEPGSTKRVWVKKPEYKIENIDAVYKTLNQDYGKLVIQQGG